MAANAVQHFCIADRARPLLFAEVDHDYPSIPLGRCRPLLKLRVDSNPSRPGKRPRLLGHVALPLMQQYCYYSNTPLGLQLNAAEVGVDKVFGKHLTASLGISLTPPLNLGQSDFVHIMHGARTPYSCDWHRIQHVCCISGGSVMRAVYDITFTSNNECSSHMIPTAWYPGRMPAGATRSTWER